MLYVLSMFLMSSMLSRLYVLSMLSVLSVIYLCVCVSIYWSIVSNTCLSIYIIKTMYIYMHISYMYRIHIQSCCVNHILIDPHGSDRPPMDLSPFKMPRYWSTGTARKTKHICAASVPVIRSSQREIFTSQVGNFPFPQLSYKAVLNSWVASCITRPATVYGWYIQSL